MLSIGPLGQLQLAQEHSSGFTQPGNDRRILFGTVIFVDGHAARGRNTLGMTKVLHSDRNTMQGTTNCAVCDLGVSLCGLRQRQVGGERRIAFQTAIEPRDTIENRSRHFDGGDLLCLNAGSDLNEIEKAKITRCHGYASGLSRTAAPIPASAAQSMSVSLRKRPKCCVAAN